MRHSGSGDDRQRPHSRSPRRARHRRVTDLPLVLEELILRGAAGLAIPLHHREDAAAEVMMLPIPRAGILHDVRGMADARAVPGIDGLEITVPRGGTVVPLPEGDRYLGFLFARGDTPAAVEAALRAAHARLDVVIS